MKITFSKTEYSHDGEWMCTIAPNVMKKGFEPIMGHMISSDEFFGTIVENPRGNNVIISASEGQPCVGIEYDVT